MAGAESEGRQEELGRCIRVLMSRNDQRVIARQRHSMLCVGADRERTCNAVDDSNRCSCTGDALLQHRTRPHEFIGTDGDHARFGDAIGALNQVECDNGAIQEYGLDRPLPVELMRRITC